MLGEEEIVGAFQHIIILLESEIKGLLLGWKEAPPNKRSEIARSNQLIARFTHFGTDVDRERFQFALCLPIFSG